MPEIPTDAIERLVKYLAKKRLLAKAAEGYERSSPEGGKLAELYRKLGPETLYRHEGPEAALTRVGEGTGNRYGLGHAIEPSGKYFASSLEDLPDLIGPTSSDWTKGRTGIGKARQAVNELSETEKPMEEFIRARLKPEARVLDAGNTKKWDSVLKEFRETLGERDKKIFDTNYYDDLSKIDWNVAEPELDYPPIRKKFTDWLKKDYDVVKFPDIVAGQPDKVQTVLLKKGAAVGRISDRYRMLGLAGAAGTGAALASQSDEAEASPIYDVIKAGSRAARRAAKQFETGSSKALAGKIFKGLHSHPISKITEHAEDFGLRNIIFENGDVREATKDSIAGLAAQQGRGKYAGLLEEKEPESQVVQAYKGLSAAYDRIKYHPEIDKKTIKQTYRDRIRHMRESGGDVVPDALVQYNNRLFTIMQPYADLLEKERDLGAEHLKGFKVVERTLNLGRMWNKPTEPLLAAGQAPVAVSAEGINVDEMRSGLEERKRLKDEAASALAKGPTAFSQRNQKRQLEKEFVQLTQKLLRIARKTEGDPGWYRVVRKDPRWLELEKQLENWED